MSEKHRIQIQLTRDERDQLARLGASDWISQQLVETTRPTLEVWAIVRPNGELIADSGFLGESHAWDCALGWPAPDEIIAAKAAGWKAVRARVAL
jgi:hypothetical protein